MCRKSSSPTYAAPPQAVRLVAMAFARRDGDELAATLALDECFVEACRRRRRLALGGLRVPTWPSCTVSLSEFHGSAVGTPETKRTSAPPMVIKKKTCRVQCACECFGSFNFFVLQHVFWFVVLVCLGSFNFFVLQHVFSVFCEHMSVQSWFCLTGAKGFFGAAVSWREM